MERNFSIYEMGSGDFMNASCAVRKTSGFLLVSIFPSIAILINMVVLLAVTFDRRRLLRQSRVYTHVNSTLVANVIFSLAALLQILSLYFNFEGHSLDRHPDKQGVVNENITDWWAFRKAFLAGMYIIMCGNIGLLIEAIRTSTCNSIRLAVGGQFTGETFESSWRLKLAAKLNKGGSDKSPESRVNLRRKSHVSIVILWTLPIAYVIAPGLGWSCASVCKCLSECYTKNVQRNHTRQCSRGLPPMASSWLVVTIALWTIGIICVILLLIRSVIVLRRISQALPSTTSFVTNENSIAVQEKDLNQNNDKSQHDSISESMNDVFKENVVWQQSKAPKKTTSKGRVSFDCLFEPDAQYKQNLHPTLSEESSQQITHDISTKIDAEKRFDDVKGNDDMNANDDKTTHTQYLQLPDHNGREKPKKKTSRGILAISQRNPRPLSKKITRMKKMSSNLKYVIWMTVVFGLSTFPTMAYLFVDMMFVNITVNMAILNACLLCPFIYCYICPFLLAKCLPGVKSALIHLLLRFCTYSTVNKK